MFTLEYTFIPNITNVRRTSIVYIFIITFKGKSQWFYSGTGLQFWAKHPFKAASFPHLALGTKGF